jgi:hypothetical protein
LCKLSVLFLFDFGVRFIFFLDGQGRVVLVFLLFLFLGGRGIVKCFAFIGKGGGDRRFPFVLAEFPSEVLVDPRFRAFVVEYELMHVVAEVSEQVLRFGEPRSFLLRVLRLQEVEVRWLFVLDDHGAAVFREFFLVVVVAVALFHLVHQFAVQGALAQ